MLRTRLLGVVGGREYRYTYPNGDLVEYVVALFDCATSGAIGEPLDPETKSLRYFSREDMPALAIPYPYDLLFG